MLGWSTMTSPGAARAQALRALGRALPVIAAGALLLGLCALRLSCIALGPDPDTDAYGHFVIARVLPDAPLNFKIHWVWLPLYHALLSLPIRLGATLDQVRGGNALLATALPVLMFLALAPARSERPVVATPARALALPAAGAWLAPWVVPLLAALLVATCPLIMQLGTTGQMEILFCSLGLLAVVLLVHGRFAAAALALCALVLTRYEGWAVAAVVGAELLRRRLATLHLTRGMWACVLAPGSCVLAWALARRLGGEPWFSFILDTHAFAERVLEQQPPAHAELAALGRYILIVPFRCFGLALLFAPFGLLRSLRRQGPWLVAPGLALLAFLTLTSLSRSQLGLDRHFVSVVPFAATWIAHGVAATAERIAGVNGSAALGRPRLAVSALALLSLVALGASLLRLEASWPEWRQATRGALLEPRDAARFVRETSPSALIVCDEASVEVLSGLPAARFSRAHLDERQIPTYEELARSREVYIVNRARRLGAFWQLGPARYGAVDGPPEAFVALRVSPERASDWVR
jgi:hypothetical protein